MGILQCVFVKILHIRKISSLLGCRARLVLEGNNLVNPLLCVGCRQCTVEPAHQVSRDLAWLALM
jgi:hypothetical protein